MADFTYQDPLYSQKPEDDGNLPSSIQYAILRALMTMMDKCLPVRVLAYDRSKNVATVQPLIYKTDTDNEVYERGAIYQVQCLSYGAGGFHINFPIAKGDLGWIITADRDIDLFKQSLAPTKTNTKRAHSLADSWFIPDTFRKYVVSGENSGDMVIQSTDTNSRVAIGKSRILIAVGSSRIVVTGSGVTITSGSATINCDATINGALQVNGPITSTGAVKGASGSFGGIPSEGHTHIDSHGGNCSPPVA